MALWIEEADKEVWHRMTERLGRGSWRAACGWELSPIAGRVWPQKPSEEGPDEVTRCRTCVGNHDGGSGD